MLSLDEEKQLHLGTGTLCSYFNTIHSYTDSNEVSVECDLSKT
jgi:hypothetical protein